MIFTFFFPGRKRNIKEVRVDPAPGSSGKSVWAINPFCKCDVNLAIRIDSSNQGLKSENGMTIFILLLYRS